MSFGIWNSIDEVALYLGIDRLPKESDDSFKNRVYNISRYMYKNDSYSMARSIAGQCGFDVLPAFQIDSAEDFKCTIDYDYFILETDTSYLRVFIGRDDIAITEILNGIDKLDDIGYTLYSPAVTGCVARNILRNTNVKFHKEFIYETSVQLKKKNIIEGSIEFEDKVNFINSVDGIPSIKNSGDYFIDYQNGYLQSKNTSDIGQIIKYSYIEKPFVVEYSDISVKPVNNCFQYGITNDSLASIEFLLHRNTWS